ncbi:MAG: hypothetical protein RXR08_11065 [Sulfolobaceae archaeon]
MKVEYLTAKLNLKVVLYEVLEHGDVIVYKVEKDDDNLKFEDFYIATFDDVRSETVWGIGSTIQDTLEDAEREWDRKEDVDDNPFREVLEMLKEVKNTNKISTNNDVPKGGKAK